MKKIIALLLVISVLVAVPEDLAAKERRGAKVLIQKKDGFVIEGELIAVKKNMLLLLDSQLGADVSIDIYNVKIIKVVKDVKATNGFYLGIGIISGGTAGAIFGGIVHPLSPRSSWKFSYVPQPIFFGVIGALAGTILALIGSNMTAKSIIEIEGSSPEEIKAVLGDLRIQARVLNYN